MNDEFWNSLPRKNVGVRRVNGAAWILLFALAGAVMIGGFIWLWI